VTGKNIFHKKRNIHSHVEEKRAGLTLLQEAIERTKQGKTKQTKNKKHTPV
jgi:hypothetical protein